MPRTSANQKKAEQAKADLATAAKASQEKADQKAADEKAATTAPATDEKATEKATEEAPKVDPVAAFKVAVEKAVEAADEKGAVPAEEEVLVVAAFLAIPKKGRDGVAARVTQEAVNRAFGAGDIPAAQAANSLGVACTAAASTAPVGSGPTPVEVGRARVGAIGLIASRLVVDLLGRAVPSGTDPEGSTPDLLAAFLGAESDEERKVLDLVVNLGMAIESDGVDLDAAWKSAFGTKAPDLTKVPGARKGGGGGGSKVSRDLSGAIGTTVTFKGTTATIVAAPDVDEKALLLADGEKVPATPSALAKKVAGGTSTNGWVAWKTEDGVTLDALGRGSE